MSSNNDIQLNKYHLVVGVAEHLDGCKCLPLSIQGDQVYVKMMEGISTGHGVLLYNHELEVMNDK